MTGDASVTPAAAVSADALRRLVRRAAVPAAAIAGVAVLLRLIYDPWYLNYDARYALLWAGDLWHGDRPDYGAPFAPTPHPLQTAVSFLAYPFGASDQIVTWLVLLAFGALGWLVYRLGAELFSPWAGIVAAVAVITRPALERDALLAYQDVPFAALIVWAVLLEARCARRGLPVLVVLAVAGLFRPEAWFLSGLYVLYLWRGTPRRERTAFCAVAASAPIVWMVSDLVIAHDALHSLHGTAALADTQDRRRHISQVPYWTLQYFGFTLREPLLVGIPIGLAFAWLYRRRQAALPVAVALVMTAVFAIGPIFGLPLIGRYLRTPAILFALFYGLAVCGWALLPEGRTRRNWFVAGMVALAASVVFLPRQIDMLDGLHTRIDRESKLYGDLRSLSDAPAVRASFRACPRLSAADHRPVPYLRYWLDGKPGSVNTIESNGHGLGLMLVVPRRTFYAKHFYRKNFPSIPRTNMRTVYENRSWRAYAAPGC